MARKRDDAGRCLDAALVLAASAGWNNVSLFDIAEETNLSLTDVTAAVGSRRGIIRLLAGRADTAMLAAVDEDWRDESIRDRLFTLFMARFDYLRTRREGIRAMITGLSTDPGAALVAATSAGLPSMKLALEAAGIATDGLRGGVRARALGVTYAIVVRTFLDDETEDLSKTMAALDQRLSSLERLAERFRGGFRPRRSSTEETAEA